MTAALSRRKLLGAAKVADVAARNDPDVAIGIAVILCAGLAGERIAASMDVTLHPDAARSADDYAAMRQELRAANLPEDAGPHETEAKRLLVIHWRRVEVLAEALLAANELAPDHVARLLASKG